MNKIIIKNCLSTVIKFVEWLDIFGERSQDWQDYYANKIGNKAKSIYYKNPYIGVITVAPMVLCETFFPKTRKLFWKKQRFPIADAHYSMGFSFLAKIFDSNRYSEKAKKYLKAIIKNRCSNYKHFCWGYPFNWGTINGIIDKGTPLITTTPYVYEAFILQYQIDENKKWLKIAKSIADHAYYDLKDIKISKNVFSCAYHPNDFKGGVINASAYRAFLLAHASVQFSEKKYWDIAKRNLNFVLETQQLDGSWYYANDGKRNFIDHFHTCFVLKALVKINFLKEQNSVKIAIEKGVKYYLKNLFDKNRLPKPFSIKPRLTLYRKELYDYAECINLLILLKGRFYELDNTLISVLEDLTTRWIKSDGSFRSRKLLFGWDNVPMHRWAQGQVFRSLCFLLHSEMKNI